MSVHEIKRTSLLNCPQRLRELADEMEKQGLRTVVCVIGYPDGCVAVRAFGERTSNLETTGWLHRGLDVLTNGCSAADADFSPTPPAA